MKRITCVLVTILGALTQPRSPVAAADWPVFRGDAAQSGVAADPLPDKLVVRWQAKTGGDVNTASVEGTAAIVDRTVFVGAFDDTLIVSLPPPALMLARTPIACTLTVSVPVCV